MGTLKLFDGNDWQKIVGSGGEKPWKLIGSVTTTEEVGEIRFDADQDGKPLELTEVIIICDATTLRTGQALAVFGSQSGAKNYFTWKSNASLGNDGANRFIVIANANEETQSWISLAGVSTGGSGSGSVTFNGNPSNTYVPFDCIRVNTNSGTVKYPAGMMVTVYGR